MANIFGHSRRALLAFAGGVLLVLAVGAAAQDNRRWQPLAADGVHNPASPAVKQLQAPSEALSKLPAGTSGDQVDWGAALKQGLIAPRAGTDPKSGTTATILDNNILLNLQGSVQPVLFSHREHTQWLDCSSCHSELFQMKSGASQISKLRMQDGEQCGVCHGAVAFPLTDCKRCHSQPWPVAQTPSRKLKLSQ